MVDGSTWSGDGLERLRQLAELVEGTRLAVSDFALARQSRWREAIASVFDDPDFLPYLRSLRRIAVTYATHDESGAAGSTNLVKPIYHVGWLASRLDLKVVKPLAAVSGPARPPSGGRPRGGTVKPAASRGLAATLSDGRSEVAVVVRPVVNTMPAGTTLRVELLAERRGSELRTDVTAEAETVHVRVWQDGVEALDRHFRAPRRGDADLLAEAIETGRRDPVSVGALRAAAALIGPDGGAIVSEPEIVVVADDAVAAAEAAAEDRHGAGRRGRAPRACRLGDDRRFGPGRALPAAGRSSARRRDPVGQRPRLVDRRSLRAARPPALEREAVRRRPPRHRQRRGRHGQQQISGRAHPDREHPPLPDGRVDRSRDRRGCGARQHSPTELRAADLPQQEGWPVFDLIVLGVGADGHILSVFPGSAAFDSTELALAIPAPTHIEPHVERVTLNPAVVEVARQLLVVVHGEEKAPVLAEVFGPERDPRRWPAQLARRASAVWILDEAAASRLPNR